MTEQENDEPLGQVKKYLHPEETYQKEVLPPTTRKTPLQWSEATGIIVENVQGWKIAPRKQLDEPLTLTEFCYRVGLGKAAFQVKKGAT